ncbi:MAG: type II secretion system F family protein [Planctomycetes bacterium]|nr:type II secretion system F family protein [Planctomycetota bacterium]
MMPLTLALELASGVQRALLIILPLMGSVVLAYGVFQVVADLRSSDRKRVIDRLRPGKSGGAGRDDPLAALADLRKQTSEASGGLARAFLKLSFTARFQTVLDQANVRWSAPQTLVNLTAIATVLLATMLVLKISFLVSAGTVAGVFIVPILYLFRRRKRRLNKLVGQLPDVFELLSQALRAGHSLASAMQLIAHEVPDPAGTEFGRVFHEQNLGLKIEDALRNLAQRTGMLDVRFFVTAVLIQRQTGGDLAEVLDKIGSVIRDRIKLFGTVQALTAEGRLSGYVLLALPVIVFFVMLQVNREYAELLIADPTGKMMLTVAVVMQLMGWAMIKKIVNIKV